MFGSTILDAAIALIFIYLLASLVVSAANEAIAGIFKSRANNLWKGIQELLRDGSNTEWATKLYEHPLIDGLSRTPTPNKDGKTKVSGKPSYIPSRTFALALLDLVAPAKPDGNRTLEDLKAGLQNLPAPLQKTLTVLLDDSQHDVEKLKTAIETWFNNGMERVAGWYKRKSQAIQFCLALLLVGLMNIDSVYIAKNLFAMNSPLRQSLVDEAKEYIAQGGPPTDHKGQLDRLEQAVGDISKFSLPIGWTDFDPKTRVPTFLLGWLVTAFAVSLGAPFWFDLLNKFINVRAAGKPPEERPKEPKEIPRPKPPGG